MRRFFKQYAILIIVLILISGFVPRIVDAQEYTQYKEGFVIIPEECINPEASDTDCGLDSFVQLFVNLAMVGLKVLPYIAMIMMIWAGFNLIISSGNPEKIQSGKKMLTSVILGVIIITILAWSWSAFIVYVLTGGTDLFSGYGIWEKKWWGGGETAELPPGKGCCYAENFGCIEYLQSECENLEITLAAVPIAVSFQGEGTSCATINECQNIIAGGGDHCCVPTDPADKVCYRPITDARDAKTGGYGCVNWEHTEFQPNSCDTVLGTECDEIKTYERPQ